MRETIQRVAACEVAPVVAVEMNIHEDVIDGLLAGPVGMGGEGGVRYDLRRTAAKIRRRERQSNTGREEY